MQSDTAPVDMLIHEIWLGINEVIFSLGNNAWSVKTSDQPYSFICEPHPVNCKKVRGNAGKKY